MEPDCHGMPSQRIKFARRRATKVGCAKLVHVIVHVNKEKKILNSMLASFVQGLQDAAAAWHEVNSRRVSLIRATIAYAKLVSRVNYDVVSVDSISQ